MAEWKARGYVPDSDEEEESQDWSLRDEDLEEAEDGGDVVVADYAYAPLEKVASDGGREGEQQEAKATQVKAVEVRIASHSDVRKISHGSAATDEDDEIDELQEDYHSLRPSAQLRAELDAKLREPKQTTSRPEGTGFRRLGEVNHVIPEDEVHLVDSEEQRKSIAMASQLQGASRQSSQLSEPSSLPSISRTIASGGNEVGDIFMHPAPPISGDRGIVSTIPGQPANSTEPMLVGDDQRPRAQRNLRQRNPIQLHPYAIENEKYRQTLKARGVKALRFAPGESQAQHAEDSQNQAFEESRSSRSSSPLAPRSLTSSPPQPANLHIENDEFPDMDALLRRQSHRLSSHRYKRRKLDTPTFKPPPPPAPRPRPLLTSGDTVMSQSGYDVYDVPPSPPPSGTQTPNSRVSPGSSKFRVPPGASIRSLPTPVTSSEPRRPPQTDFLNLEDLDEEAVATGSTEVESDSTVPPSEDESVNRLHQVKRKIRGVLPASWLKLDLNTQAKKADKHCEPPVTASPEKRESHKGIARPIPRTGKGTSSRQTGREIFVLSDEESTSNEDATPQRLRLEQSDLNHVDDDEIATIDSSRLGEAVEGDEVDAMLPTARRPSYHSEKHRKRQRQLFDYGVHPTTRNIHVTKRMRLPNRLTSQVSASTLSARVHKPRFHPPKLSILDSPIESDAITAPTTPHFLKIASRTVRSRRDKGRHSPSQKYLRLATRDDTADANRSLQAWREGTIAPSYNQPANNQPFRQPLLPRSGNGVLPSVTHLVKRPAASAKQFASIRRLQPSTQMARNVQSTLDRVMDSRLAIAPAEAQEVVQLEEVAPTNRTTSKGQLMPSLKNIRGFRPAMLETLQEEEDRTHPRHAFTRDLSRMSHPGRLPQPDVPLWQRTAPITSPRNLIPDAPRISTKQEQPNRGLKSDSSTRPRKRRPRRIDTAMNFQDLDYPTPDIFTLSEEMHQEQSYNVPHGISTGPVLLGLGPFGTQYTSTFDVMPFPPGTCFHQSTFLGSGDFRRSLKLVDYPLDQPRGYAVVRHGNASYRWGPWTEPVSSELGSLWGSLMQALRDEPTSQSLNRLVNGQRHIANYFSDHLNFLDAVDRLAYLQRCIVLLEEVAVELPQESVGSKPQSETVRRDMSDGIVRLSALNLVLANQLRQISQHSLVPDTLKHRVQIVLEQCCDRLRGNIHSTFGNLARTLSSLQRSTDASLTIGENVFAEAIVITRIALAHDDLLQRRFWDTLLSAAMSTRHDDVSSTLLEDRWRSIFTILPILEFDAQGVLESGRRFKAITDFWSPVRKLISPVLSIYTSKQRGQSPSFNQYFRALFSRCLYLINSWGWRNCDSIIGTLFDFFARTGLSHLRNEECQGSPNFLERLSDQLALVAEAEDRCFHLLLKIIGCGIRFMRRTYTEKKIRDLVWRLMPNHGRSHPKDEALQQEDLDALRNHHDLLCTLYWASPPAIRPRLSVIRNLVHVENSHKEACHINIRSWSRLVRYQLSTDEPLSSLDGFVEWHDDLLHQILRQHGLARTEAEEQVKSFQNTQGLLISQQLLESTIAKNQRQVESILADALACLRRAMQSAWTKEAADKMISPKLTLVFAIFDSKRSETSSPLLEALEIIHAYIGRSTELDRLIAKGNDNEDSQDFGDWTAFDESDMIGLSSVPTISPLQHIHDPLRHLLSNCLGADVPPSDTLLAKLVETWAVVGQRLVQTKLKSWSDYVGGYGNDAWSSLRDTDQTRKYTAYYLALLVEKNTNVYGDNKALFLLFWVESLVERESLFKFQHRLTSALLNADTGDQLLLNPPFWKDRTSGRFEITAVLFSERRLSLISTLLSNMRTGLEDAHDGDNVIQRKQEYKDLLKHMMAKMKLNYQELGHGSNIKGSYVDFVHKIIEVLQQHTANICPVDRFFTDNISFPLPATDPTYVVGQLKNYGLRLQDPRAPKELAIFLQSVSERAIIDNQQAYLVDQLYNSMRDNFEDGGSKPTLRACIMKTIVPAYLELAFKSSCGWILAMPYLEAARLAFKDLLLDLDGYNIGSVDCMSSTVSSFLATMQTSLRPLIQQSFLLQRTSMMKTLRACYRCATALLPTLDYLRRLDGLLEDAVQCIESLDTFAQDILLKTTLTDTDPLGFSPADRPSLESGVMFETRRYASEELRQTLKRSWICIDERYFVARGSSRKEIVVDIGLFEEEKEELHKALRGFRESLQDTLAFGNSENQEGLHTNAVAGLEYLTI